MYIEKKKSGSEKLEIWAVVAENRARGFMRETLGIIQGKISFSFHCCWVFYFDLMLNLQLMQCVVETHSPAISVPVVNLHLDCSVGEKRVSVLSNRMFFIHHKAPARRGIIYE